MQDVAELAVLWRNAVADLRFIHQNPSTTIELVVSERPKCVRVLFRMTKLEDSRSACGETLDDLDYYFEPNHWPGETRARMWTLSAWTLLAEHEALEFAFYASGGTHVHLADPHTSPWCAAHWRDLEKRSDMAYMLARLEGES